MHWLDWLGEQGRLHEVGAFVQKVCAPVFFRTHAGKLHNGSMVLVTDMSDSTRLMGITAGHVADALVVENLGDVPDCQVGAAELGIGGMIDRSKDLDLASYTLDEATVRQSRHQAFLVRSWPLPVPNEKDVIITGGWPGCYRTNPQGRYDNAFAWVAGQVQSVSENDMGIVVNLGGPVGQ